MHPSPVALLTMGDAELTTYRAELAQLWTDASDGDPYRARMNLIDAIMDDRKRTKTSPLASAERTSRLGDPPAELADAWARYQRGDDVEGWELSKLDEWRADRAQEAGF